MQFMQPTLLTVTHDVMLILTVHTFFCIWYLHTLSIAALKLPSMKRALYTVFHHPSSHSQVGAQVRAVTIHHVGLPLLAAEHRHLLTWEIHYSRDENFELTDLHVNVK